MKRHLPSLLAFVLAISSVMAQPSKPDDRFDVATTWPEIHFQVFQIDRIAGHRLVVFVRVYASANAPVGGTFIAATISIPKDATPSMIDSGLYAPKPFSLESAIMTDEATKQTYPTLKPDLAGPSYFPGKIIETLRPKEADMMSIQFPAPPPPPSVDGGPPPTQTISILLPNAKGPITGIIIPPSK